MESPWEDVGPMYSPREDVGPTGSPWVDVRPMRSPREVNGKPMGIPRSRGKPMRSTWGFFGPMGSPWKLEIMATQPVSGHGEGDDEFDREIKTFGASCSDWAIFCAEIIVDDES